LSLSGAREGAVVEGEKASRKPKPVTGSGDSWITRAFGREVSEVGDVVRDCRRCR
jgi:hypothetical protein